MSPFNILVTFFFVLDEPVADERIGLDTNRTKSSGPFAILSLFIKSRLHVNTLTLDQVEAARCSS